MVPQSFHYDPHDTIAAIATAPGGAARGVVRLSGAQVLDCVTEIFVANDNRQVDKIGVPTVVAGQIRLNGRHGIDESGSSTLPCDLLLWPGRRSYTREPVAEMHTLGSPPLLEAVLESACRSGARPAGPGEFTLRAFLAGRIDLTQAEAVLGVIDADDAQQLNAALAQLAGGLAKPLDRLRDELLQLLAEIEAGMDFVDEDIEFISSTEIAARILAAIGNVNSVINQLETRGDVRTERRVALVGPPNAGKSSLFNALADRFQVARFDSSVRSGEAIVSPQAGTTRDYLSAELEVEGLRFQLVDTAGVANRFGLGNEQEASISTMAQRHAAAQARGAHLRIRCHDATLEEVPTDGDENWVLRVYTKVDLLAKERIAAQDANRDPKSILTSSVTGDGLDVLAGAIRSALVTEARGGTSTAVTSTAARCRESLRMALASLARSHELTVQQSGDELVASELRMALNELGKVVGAVYTDDILDRVFSSFCIGK